MQGLFSISFVLHLVWKPVSNCKTNRCLTFIYYKKIVRQCKTKYFNVRQIKLLTKRKTPPSFESGVPPMSCHLKLLDQPPLRKGTSHCPLSRSWREVHPGEWETHWRGTRVGSLPCPPEPHQGSIPPLE